MSQSARPGRLAVTDETGAKRTLAAGSEAFTIFGQGPEPIFLGLGPDPGLAAGRVPGRQAAYVECPAFAAAMPPAWHAAIPATWRRLDPAELTSTRAARSTFHLYRQNPRLYPSFWGPIWARIQLALLPRPEIAPHAATILVAQGPGGLLEPEIARALTALGKTVTPIPADTAGSAVAAACCASRPEAFVCVNGAGLDDDGLVASLLREAGIPVAVWFVDNPFHTLGRFRGAFWKDLLLCVTDAAFLTPLRELGAAHVLFLPLAAAEHFFAAKPEPRISAQVLFVGRSAFAGRDSFFAGCRVPEALAATARNMLAAGQRPDFSWWRTQLGQTPLWPGKAPRQAGYGAEMASLAHRAGVLTALAGAVPLTVFGDAAWDDLLPPKTVRHDPVDYYGRLPGLYAGAGLVANVTSLLLPRGLTQRHFDVWAAGGCLLSDATPGLDLFPTALTQPITFDTPAAAATLARELLAAPSRRADLGAAWRETITTAHRYEHRLARLLEEAARLR